MRNDRTLDNANRHFYQWTGPELEIVHRADLTIEQMANMLGRTYEAVAIQRRLSQVDPRKHSMAGVTNRERTSR